MEAPDVITLKPNIDNYPTPVQNPPDLTYEPRSRLMMESPPPNITGHDFSAYPATIPSQQVNPPNDVTTARETINNQIQIDVKESELAPIKQRLFKLEDRLNSLEANGKWNNRLIKLLILAGGVIAIWAYTKQR